MAIFPGRFPSQIIAEILGRLPVKPLLRFRCVSKPWCSLIDSKYFIKLHLNNSVETNSNQTVITKSSDIFFVDLDSFELLDAGKFQFDNTFIVSSCNGLVLVKLGKDFILWNPSTRKYRKLPPIPPELESSRGRVVRYRYSFGYDSKNDDYKVVNVSQGERGSFCEAKVYSLKSDSWIRVEDFPYVWHTGLFGVYLNDALHTLVHPKTLSVDEWIMAFHLGTMKHYEIPRPDCMLETNMVSIEVMGGFLTAVYFGETNMTEIWVMKEYRVKESWTKLICFEMHPVGLCPLGFSKNDDEILLNDGGLGFYKYDLREKTARVISFPGLSAILTFDEEIGSVIPFHAYVCIGSLVSLDSVGATENQDGRSQRDDELFSWMGPDALEHLKLEG